MDNANMTNRNLIDPNNFGTWGKKIVVGYAGKFRGQFP